MVACPLVVNGVEPVLSQLRLGGPESWWRGWHDVLAGWCSARLTEGSARAEGASGGLPPG